MFAKSKVNNQKPRQMFEMKEDNIQAMNKLALAKKAVDYQYSCSNHKNLQNLKTPLRVVKKTRSNRIATNFVCEQLNITDYLGRIALKRPARGWRR